MKVSKLSAETEYVEINRMISTSVIERSNKSHPVIFTSFTSGSPARKAFRLESVVSAI